MNRVAECIYQLLENMLVCTVVKFADSELGGKSSTVVHSVWTRQSGRAGLQEKQTPNIKR